MERFFSELEQFIAYQINIVKAVFLGGLDRLNDSEFNNFTADELNNMAHLWAWESLTTATERQLGGWLNANPKQMGMLNNDALGYFSKYAVSLLTDEAAAQISGEAWIAWIKADPKLYFSGFSKKWGERHDAHVLKPSAFTLFSRQNLVDLASAGQTVTLHQFSYWITSHKTIPVRQLDAEVFSLFNGGILNTLSGDQLAGLNASQVARLRLGEVSTLNGKTMNLLSASAIAGFTGGQIAAIDSAAFADWASSRIHTLKATQLAAVTSGQVAVLRVDTFKALTAATLNGMSGAWGGITNQQIHAIPDVVFSRLNATLLNRLTPAAASAIRLSDWVVWFRARHHISELSANLIAGLPMVFLERITPQMVKAMSSEQIESLGGWFGALRADCLQALSGSQWRVVTSIEFASLTTKQLASLGPQAWKNLSKEAISTLTPEKVKFIRPSELALIPADRFSAFSFQAVKSMTGVQIQSLSSAQITALSLTLSSSEYAELDSKVHSSLITRGVAPLPNKVQTWRGESKASLLDLSLMATTVYSMGIGNIPEKMVITPPPSWILLDQKVGAGGFKAAAWQRGCTIVIAIAGTDDKMDMVANAELLVYALGVPFTLTNEFSSQVFSALSFYAELKQKNPAADFIFTGHSLGGGLSSALGVLLGTTTLAFDEAPVMSVLRNFVFVLTIEAWIIRNEASLTADTVSRLRAYVLCGKNNLAEYISSGGEINRDKFIYERAQNVSAVRVSGEALDMAQDVVRDITPLPDGRVATDIFEFDSAAADLVGAMFLRGTFDESVRDIAQKHQYVTLIAAAASSDFCKNLASLGLMSSALYDQMDGTYATQRLFSPAPFDFLSPAPFEMIMHDFSVKYGEGKAGQSALIKWSADLSTLVEHNGFSSTAWRMGTKLSMALIGASAYDYAYASQSIRPNIFSGIAGGVLAQFSAAEKDNVDLESIEEVFHSQVTLFQTDPEIFDLVDQRIGGVQNWALQDESGRALVFDGASVKGNIAVLGSVDGSNYIKGGVGDMVAVGGRDQNWMYGGLGDDVLVGGKGANYFDGGGGNNVLVGGAGVDVFAFSSHGDGYDVVHNFSQAGGDVLDFRSLENNLGLKFSFEENASSIVANSRLGAMWFDASQQALFVNARLGSGPYLAAHLSGVTSVMSSSILLGMS